MTPQAWGTSISNSFLTLSWRHLWNWQRGSCYSPTWNPSIISYQFRVKNKTFHMAFKVLSELSSVSLSRQHFIFWLISFSLRIFTKLCWAFIWIYVKLSLSELINTGSLQDPWGLVCAWVLMKMRTVIGAVLNDIFQLCCSGWCTNICVFIDHPTARSPGQLIRLGW